jgi:hypothetical protein
MKHNIKLQRAIKQSNIFKGQSTVSAIVAQLPESLLETLSSKNVAIVLDAIDKAYKTGKASAGAEIIDNNAVYINGNNKIVEIM